MEYSILPLDEKNRKEWDAFCSAASGAWFRHTTAFIDYILSCRFDGKSRNLSFGIYQSGGLAGIVPLVAQTVYGEDDLYEFAFTDSNTPFPVVDDSIEGDERDRMLEIAFDRIDKIACDGNIQYSRFFVDSSPDNVRVSKDRANPLLKFGYQDTSISTNLIDLRIPEEGLFRNVRKGHKCDIKTASKNGFAADIYDSRNITREAFDAYRQIHFMDAGRKTRPDLSWDMMYSFITSGNALLVLVGKGGQPISGAVVILYKGRAYYGSGATHPDFDKSTGIGHFLQWTTMVALKNAGASYYETGWNFKPGISQGVVSDKEVNISKFKSGFGGEKYVLFRGEKFYSKDYMSAVCSRRADEYARTLK